MAKVFDVLHPSLSDSYHLHEYQISYHLHELLVQLNEETGINSPTFARLAMAARVVFLLALYKPFSGLPVPFCIDLARRSGRM